MTTIQSEVDQRTNLTSHNQFEMLLFRLGGDASGERSELYGINVFKIREILAMPTVTAVAGALPHMLGVVNIRGQIIPVIDLPGIVGCSPKTGLNIMLITEFARTTQAFAVESVEDIVRLAWNDVLPAQGGAANSLITSIARLDGDVSGSRLVQVLDVETLVRQLTPSAVDDASRVGQSLQFPAGTSILAADDSSVARALIEQALNALHAPYIMTRSGKELWDRLNSIADAAEAEGLTVQDKVSLVLTDLEMPEMDGFTLTRKIKQDPRFSALRVVIHSSLSGSANEEHVRRVGADAYVAKFVAEDLAQTLRTVMAKPAKAA